MKKATILHDLIVYKFPQTTHNQTNVNIQTGTISANIVNTQKRKLAWVTKESGYIVCDSQSTKQDAQDLLQISETKLDVIYPGVKVETVPKQTVTETMEKYHVQKPYILSVGKIEPRKNIKRLIEAFQQSKLKDTELIIIGPLGWDEKEIMKTQPHIRFLGYINDTELYSFYTNALFFVYPSLYEGFGLPIVEAMNFGCPVASSNTSSMKEITQDYGVLFDPENVASVKDAIISLSSNEDLRNKLSKKSLERAKYFSQQRFTQEWFNVFDKIEKELNLSPHTV
jgi:glycosyltransferase involved in cell wall biosynthesis